MRLPTQDELNNMVEIRTRLADFLITAIDFFGARH